MNVKEAAFYFAEIMIRHFVFSIFIMAILAAHQVIAADVDSRCLVQGSPWAYDSSRLFVRGKDNHLREWQRDVWGHRGERGDWNVFDLSNIEKQPRLIMSDPSFFSEWVNVYQTDEEGKFILDDDRDPISEKTQIERVIARGERGHLFEWQRRLIVSGKTWEPWKWSDLTKEVTGRHIVAGTPSRTSNGMYDFIVTADLIDVDIETYENFFTPTPDDRLLRWSLQDSSPNDDLTSDDELVWSVVDLTNDSNGQTSAGNIVFDYWNNNIFTRDLNGHLLIGWLPFQSPSVDHESYGAGKIDLTIAVGGQTIIGDPVGYGIWLGEGLWPQGVSQHVFARDLKGHLYEWRHIWERKKVVLSRNGPHTKAWREAMQSGWQLTDLTEAVGGRTVEGDPAVYITIAQFEKNVVTAFLNVLARNSDGHLLKWSVVHSYWAGDADDPFRRKWNFSLEENGRWVLEDLTEAVGGTIIKGDPMMVKTRNFISPNAYAITERIFAEGKDNHLLEWYRDWVTETEGDSWNYIFVVPSQSGWKVSDLTTKHCNPTDIENLTILPVQPEDNNRCPNDQDDESHTLDPFCQ